MSDTRKRLTKEERITTILEASIEVMLLVSSFICE